MLMMLRHQALYEIEELTYILRLHHGNGFQRSHQKLLQSSVAKCLSSEQPRFKKKKEDDAHLYAH